MDPTITCPMCQADVVLTDDRAKALCAECHDMSDEQLRQELQKRVDRAVWKALRAVEDQAAYFRWAAERGDRVPPDAVDSHEAATLLRQVLTTAKRSQ